MIYTTGAAAKKSSLEFMIKEDIRVYKKTKQGEINKFSHVLVLVNLRAKVRFEQEKISNIA